MSDKDNGESGSKNQNEDQELDKDLEGIEDPALLREEAKKARAFGRQQNTRAKKAEKEATDLKEKKTPEEEEKPNKETSHTSKPAITAETVDERVLQAQGISKEDIDFLKKIAAVNGTSLIDAQKDELFVARKAKQEEEAKKEKARLGASKGSGSEAKKKDLNTPGLAPKDHKELWKEQNDK